MPTKTKPTKIPTRTVVADDLAVEVDGETYYPHAGEVVTFRGRMSVGDYLNSAKLAALGSDMSAEQVDKLDDLFGQTIEALAKRIVSWDWTDDAGDPLPSPPDADVLRGLATEEVQWLIGKSAGVRSEDEQGNA